MLGRIAGMQVFTDAVPDFC